MKIGPQGLDIRDGRLHLGAVRVVARFQGIDNRAEHGVGLLGYRLGFAVAAVFHVLFLNRCQVRLALACFLLGALLDALLVILVVEVVEVRFVGEGEAAEMVAFGDENACLL